MHDWASIIFDWATAGSHSQRDQQYTETRQEFEFHGQWDSKINASLHK
jgi:hypothetical protein